MEKTKVVKLVDVVKAIMDLPNAPNGYSDSYDKQTFLNAIEDVTTYNVELPSRNKK